MLVGVIALVAKHRFQARLTVVLLLLATALSLLAPVYLFCWLAGSIAYLLLRAVRPTIASVCVALVLLLGSIAILQLGSGGSMSARLSNQWAQGAATIKVFSQLLLAGCFAYLFVAVAGLKPQTRPTLALERLGTYCAGFSFSLYLIHYPLLNLLAYLWAGKYKVVEPLSLSVYAIAVVGCCGIAWVISLFVERNVRAIRLAVRQRLGKSFLVEP